MRPDGSDRQVLGSADGSDLFVVTLADGSIRQ